MPRIRIQNQVVTSKLRDSLSKFNLFTRTTSPHKNVLFWLYSLFVCRTRKLSLKTRLSFFIKKEWNFRWKTRPWRTCLGPNVEWNKRWQWRDDKKCLIHHLQWLFLLTNVTAMKMKGRVERSDCQFKFWQMKTSFYLHLKRVQIRN